MASVAAVRRGGGMTTVDTMNHFMLNKEMIVVSSTYWNMVYGKNIGDVLNDEEGMANMRNLGENMSFVLKNHIMNVKAELPRFIENSTNLRLNDVNIEPEKIRAIMINEVVPVDSDDDFYGKPVLLSEGQTCADFFARTSARPEARRINTSLLP